MSFTLSSNLESTLMRNIPSGTALHVPRLAVLLQQMCASLNMKEYIIASCCCLLYTYDSTCTISICIHYDVLLLLVMIQSQCTLRIDAQYDFGVSNIIRVNLNLLGSKIRIPLTFYSYLLYRISPYMDNDVP